MDTVESVVEQKIKTCRHCNRIWALDQFTKSKSHQGGLFPDCKKCQHDRYFLRSRKNGVREHGVAQRENRVLHGGGVKEYICEPNGLRKCSKCDKEKHPTHYGFVGPSELELGTERRRKRWCKECSSNHAKADHLRRLYGMTLKEFSNKLSLQGGVCAICRSDTPGPWGRFAVDHDHATGKIRGLLCNNCNRAMGLLKENITSLRLMIEYLNKWAMIKCF